MNHGLAAALARGRVVGTFLKMPGVVGVDLASELLDFAVVDREHSALGEAEALAMIRHGAALGLPTLLRVPELSASEVNRALEAGATGIQLSQVRTAHEVRALRAACEYAPRGRRSISLAHPVARYGGTSLRDYVAASAGRALVVAQVESVLEPDAYREILAARPDVAFIGVADLTVEAGFDDAHVARLVDAIADAAADAGVALGAFGLAADERVRYLMVSSDLAMLRAGMANARRAAGDEPPPPTGGDR